MLVDSTTGQAISREWVIPSFHFIDECILQRPTNICSLLLKRQLYQLEQRMQELSGACQERSDAVEDSHGDQELDADPDAETPSAILQGGGLK